MASIRQAVAVVTGLLSHKRWATWLLRQLVRLLPARSRERYGAELADVYAALLADAARTGNVLRFWQQAVSLLADFGRSLGTEYLDLWRASRVNPHVSGIALLLASGIVWTLIIIASATGSAWATQLLDASLGLTMAMAFGFPAAAFLLSRIRLVPYARESMASQLTCTAGTAVFASWVVLALHLGQAAP